jgi:dienelactone hydrolase
MRRTRALSRTRPRRNAIIPAALGLLVALGLTGCLPADPGPGGLYRGQQASITPVVTPKAAPIVWGSAPVIDEHYGGTLYAGTGMETQDPRPPLLPGGLQPLRLWVASPDDGRTARPAILWVHGGGFFAGVDSMYGLASGVGRDYAKRGYVGISVEYRIDTTSVGTGARPPSLCQWVQDNPAPTDPVWLARRDQCARNILAAQHDTQAAVRWVRAHAAELGVDPNKIAVGGLSAGAVTALNVAYQTDTVADLGPDSYFAGDPRTVAASKVKAALAASGCVYSLDGGVPASIGAGDAPTAGIASELDQAVPYGCVATTVTAARGDGLVAELTSYCDQGGHAKDLYDANKAVTDEAWTTFLVRHLGIYSGTRLPTADSTC